MSEWVLQKAAEFCASVRDGTHDSPKSVDHGGKPLVTSKVVKQGFIRVEDAYLISEKDYRKINERSKVDRWDILMTMIGTVGECAIVKDDPDYAIKNIALFKMSGDEEKAKWLYYYLTSPMGQGALRENFRGSSQQYISLDQLRNLEIPVPEKDVRLQIVAILSDYDSAIDNTRRQIVLLEEAAMRLYREWFVVNADPKWEKGAVRKWFEITIGRTPPRKIAANFSEAATDQKWCSIKDLQNSNIFISETAEMLTKQGVESSKIHISPAGTIFLSFKLTVGKVAITLEPMATNEAIAHFETTDRALRDYTYCYLHEFQYDTLGSTSSIGKAINSEIVRDMLFVMPDAKTLTRFSDMVSPIFDQIQNSVVFIRTLTEARDRLLPKLMSGEVSV